MPGKQGWILAAGIGGVLIAVLAALLMQQPERAIIITTQTEPPSAAVTGTELSDSPAYKTAAPLVSATLTRQTTAFSFPAETPDNNLNTADEAALQEVSGVGAVLAAEIIAYRDSAGGFSRRSQLLEIPGIGEKLAARIMAYFYIPDELPDEETSEAEPEQADTENAPAEPQGQELVMIDLNAADKDDLMRLPDMTGALADAIIALRERLGGYQNLNELLLIEKMNGEYFEHTLRQHIYIEKSEE